MAKFSFISMRLSLSRAAWRAIEAFFCATLLFDLVLAEVLLESKLLSEQSLILTWARFRMVIVDGHIIQALANVLRELPSIERLIV